MAVAGGHPKSMGDHQDLSMSLIISDVRNNSIGGAITGVPTRFEISRPSCIWVNPVKGLVRKPKPDVTQPCTGQMEGVWVNISFLVCKSFSSSERLSSLGHRPLTGGVRHRSSSVEPVPYHLSHLFNFSRISEGDGPPIPIKEVVSCPFSRLAMIRIFLSKSFNLESCLSRSSILAEKN